VVPAALRSAALGNCEECGRAEWSVTADRVVLATTGPTDCAALGAASQPALASFVGAAPSEEAGFAGPLSALVGEGEPTPSCGVVGVVLPAGARYVGYRYAAVDSGGTGLCVADKPCSLPQARWVGHPKVELGAGRTVIWGVFANNATDRDRRARLTVYFVPAEGWEPPGVR
jgi:hypothetical protein